MHGAVALTPLPRTSWIPTDLSGVFALLRRYWLLLLACALAGVLALLASAIVISGPSYTVTSKILVNLGPEMATTPLLTAREAALPAPAMRRPEDPATGVEIFTDPRLIRDVVASLGDEFFADTPPVTTFQRAKHAVKSVIRGAQDMVRESLVLVGLRPPTTRQERLTLAIGAAMRVEPVRRSDIISLSIGFPDPRAGEIILERFIDLALSRYREAFRSPGVIDFFAEGRAERHAAIRSAEARLLALRLGVENPIWSVAEQRTVLIRAEADSQAQLRQMRSAIAATEAQIEEGEKVLAQLPQEVELSTVRSRNAATDAMRSRLVQLRLDLGMQQARYGEGSQEIGDVRRQIDALQAQVAAEDPFVVEQMTLGLSQLHQAAARDLVARRAELAGLRGSADRLGAQIDGLRAQLRQIEEAAVEIALLEQEVARLRGALEVFGRGYEDARVREAIEAVRLSGLRVVMPPTSEILPSSPSLRRTLLLGLMGGLVLGGGLVMLLEFRAAQRRRLPEGRTT
jgi:uncharacterized protein involved in exopolysaccharide biosynthesis